MEVAGLAIGVISIASLFQTCVQLFDVISLGRTRGKDYEILSCKLEVERLRLIVWGQKIGLSNPRTRVEAASLAPSVPNSPTALESWSGYPRISSLISHILTCLKLIFEDVERLERRYGLRKVPHLPQLGQQLAGGFFMPTTFRQVHDDLQLTMKESQRETVVLAKARWAILDRTKFSTLIEDIKGFNDSLYFIISNPPISAPTQLQDGLHTSDNFQNKQVNADESSTNSRSTNVMANPLLAPSSGDDNLNKLEDALAERGKGALRLSVLQKDQFKIETHVCWHGRNEEHVTLSPKPIHAALALMHASEINKRIAVDFGDFDPEADSGYEGMVPGTTSLTGFSREYNYHIKRNVAPVFYKPDPPPLYTVKSLLDRIAELKMRRFGEENMDVNRDSNFKISLGMETSTLLNVSEPLAMTNRISSLSSALNNPAFGDFAMSSNVALAATLPPPSGLGLPRFLHQVLLSHELALRLDTSDYGKCTAKVLAGTLISALWIQNVKIISNGSEVKSESLVHKRQIDGLQRFAELIEWPHIPELRENSKTIYSHLHAGGTVPLDLWDWVFGVVTPGYLFSVKIMSALVLATPSTKAMGAAPIWSGGLALSGRTYWRARSVLGKVLGGIKGVKAMCGWIGPCPRLENQNIEGWIRIRSEAVMFLSFNNITSSYVSTNFDTDYELDKLSMNHRNWQKDNVQPVLSEANDLSKWVHVQPPQLSTRRCAIKGILLESVIRSNSRIADVKNENQPRLTFIIDSTSVTYTLYSNPLFVAVPSCFNGPHLVRNRQLSYLGKVWDVADLKTALSNTRDVMIINATCEGGDAIARAWCSERGKHAAVARRSETCFACALETVSNRSLRIEVLIWS